MTEYNPRKIEKKWQRIWEKLQIYNTKDSIKGKKNFYHLVMFPYPSGDLHMGHWYNYAPADVYARFKKMRGFNVMSPIGFDAFGLPAENAAIKRKIHPKDWTYKNIKTMTEQIKSIGAMYDWSRKVITSDPEYYKWTQWMFLQFYKNGLAYKKKAPANWCPKCHTVLANEQVVDGKCERCEAEVVQREIEQWLFRITKYADRLLNDLDALDWPEKTKIMQKNWIGKSEGAEVEFKIKSEKLKIKVFTTRIDTIFGCTYVVVAPEHKIIKNLKLKIKNYDEVNNYLRESGHKLERERLAEDKQKSGVELKGIKAINPFNNEEVPIFVADYVLGHYGTGAVMAVPAHDERDFEFAKKYGLPIKQSITPDCEGYKKTIKTLEILKEIYDAANKKNVKFWLLGGLACAFYSKIIYREHNDLDLIIKNKNQQEEFVILLKELGFNKIGEKKLSKNLVNLIYEKDGVEIDIGPNEEEFGLTEKDFEEDIKKLNNFESRVLSLKFIKSFKESQLKTRDNEKDKIDWEYLNGKVFIEGGFMVNSGNYTGLTSEKARNEMTKWLEEKKLGKRQVNYKLRDWLVSRQRYWGAPIPIIYCPKCGEVAVPEKDLPVLLPNVKNYLPTEEGKSPLAHSGKFVNVKCPKCGSKATRETDTMDTFVCSSWYYLRYADPKNKNKFADSKKMKAWLPVDMYVGGTEHTVLHLLYSRFFTKVLKDLKYADFKEPFLSLRHQGIILGPDGQKMSKSRGNIIDPDELVKNYGADAVRMYLCFMGEYSQGGPWSPTGIMGTKRFLERVWKLAHKVKPCASRKGLTFALHKTIKKVTEDIENFKFNTAISAMMILVNELEKEKSLKIENWKLIIKLLAPFAPHITEEIWRKLGHKKSIFLEPWPKYDPKKIKEEIFELVVQINGKVRDKTEAKRGISQKEAEQLTLNRENVKRYINGKRVQKIIFVPDKLINIVI